MAASAPLADLADADDPTLATYLRWVRRRWWVLSLGAVLGVLAGQLVTMVQPRAYESVAEVAVHAVGAEDTPGVKVNLDSEARMVQSLMVAAKARELMHSSRSVEELAEAVTITVPPNSQMLQIAYEGPTPLDAQAGAHAFAASYLDVRETGARKRVDDEKSALDAQIKDLTKQLDAIVAKIDNTPVGSVEHGQAQAERSGLADQLGDLHKRRNPLLSAPVDPGSIISDSQLPTEPSSPNQLLNLASGFGVGLLLALVVALIMDRLDTRVRRSADIADRFGLRVLMAATGRVNQLAILPPHHHLSREASRLRNVLLTAVPDGPGQHRGRLVLVTPASTGNASSFVVANLAAAYARTGQQVVVVSTMADSPLAAMVGADPHARGLAEVLRRDVSALQALTTAPGLPSLRVLLPGGLDAQLELPIAGLREVLAQLADRFAHVLVETASPQVAVEAQALAGHVDAVLLVAETGRTKSREIAAALHQFAQVGAAVAGAVLAPTTPSTVASTSVDLTAHATELVGPAPVPRQRRDDDSDSTMILPRVVSHAVAPSPPALAPTPQPLPRHAVAGAPPAPPKPVAAPATAPVAATESAAAAAPVAAATVPQPRVASAPVRPLPPQPDAVSHSNGAGPRLNGRIVPRPFDWDSAEDEA